jgi:hypothetical protein
MACDCNHNCNRSASGRPPRLGYQWTGLVLRIPGGSPRRSGLLRCPGLVAGVCCVPYRLAGYYWRALLTSARLPWRDRHARDDEGVNGD